MVTYTFILSALAAVAVLTGFFGLIYGVTGRADRRRALGLRLLQGGMTAGGLLMIGSALAGGEGSDAIYGLLLLVFGTGVTAISSRSSKAD
jgi:hypothetical protein